MAGWVGPGFVDAHAHLLRTSARAPAPYQLNRPGSISAWHQAVHVRGSTPMDEDRDPPAQATDLAAGLRRAAALGLVEVWEAGVDVGAYLPALTALREQGPLPVRVRLLMASGSARPDQARLGDPWLEVAGVKFYADGWLGPRTCAMCRPFADRPGDSGLLFLDAEAIARRAAPFFDAGWVVATHAIGDRAIEAALAGYEVILAGQRAPAGRLRIEHAQCLRADLIDQMAALGIAACIQPSFATSDAAAAALALGSDSRETAYRWDVLLERGVPVIAGSDFPIETLNPMVGLQRLVAGVPGLSPGLPLDTALGLMTDEQSGTTTLAADPAALSPEQLATVEILGTEPAATLGANSG